METFKRTKLKVEESDYTASELTQTCPKIRVHGIVTLASPKHAASFLTDSTFEPLKHVHMADGQP